MKELVVVPIRRLITFTLVILLLSQGFISFFAWTVIENKIRPELDRKALVVSISLSNKIKRALDYGIPFEKLSGVDEFFKEVLKYNKDLGFLALADGKGRIIQSVGADAEQLDHTLSAIPNRENGRPYDIFLPGEKGVGGSFFNTAEAIEYRGKVLGTVHVGVDQGYVASRISGLRYDIGIVLLTSMLIAFEILLFIVSLNYLGPMNQVAEMMAHMARGDFSNRAVVTVRESVGSLAERLNQICSTVNQRFGQLVLHAATISTGNPKNGAQAGSLLHQLRERYMFVEQGEARALVQQRVVIIRILTFMFMFAEMLSRSFLPVYILSMPDPGLGISPNVLASLPLTFNLLCVAGCLPFAGRWSDRIGRRSSFALGAAVLMLGLITTGMAHHFLVLLAGRMVSGVGYALLFMTCQGYVVDNTSTGNRSQGMAAFVSAIMVAEICAPAIGGILADRIGYHLVFLCGAVIAVLATLLAIRMLDNQPVKGEKSGPGHKIKLSMLLANRRFVALAFLTGVPAKLLLSGFLFYLVPLILTSLDSTSSEVGRYTMVYGVITLALGPLFARLADRHDAHGILVAAGGVLSGAGLLSILIGVSTAAILVGIAALGLGQSMSISTQLGLVAKVTQVESKSSSPTVVLGLFRLVERLGGAAGPIVAGLISAVFSPSVAMTALGALSLICSAAFYCIFRSSGKKDDMPGSALNGGTAS